MDAGVIYICIFSGALRGRADPCRRSDREKWILVTFIALCGFTIILEDSSVDLPVLLER
jgi:hypothetical protein